MHGVMMKRYVVVVFVASEDQVVGEEDVNVCKMKICLRRALPWKWKAVPDQHPLQQTQKAERILP